MEKTLLVLVALVLVSSCKGQEWTPPGFCHQKKCPEFKVVETKQDFEERLYVATEWITTKVESSQTSDVMAAYSRLKNYCQKQKKAGYKIPKDTWPALISVTEGKNGSAVSMSWFVPPGTKTPENTDESVTLQSRPETTVYVRVFGGTPSIESGQENAKLLREALAKAGKTFDPNTYSGAGYDNYISLTHHNEIWIFAV
ncbi:heme-binding protein 2-like [Scomber scombrus]|uniref:Heme-binding protein 2-like n=1 Tax=Scomber scombrus TaxID=13677 RepID=A0AAV1PWX6_SCOSC